MNLARRFWTEPESTATLCLFRIVWTAIFLLNIATRTRSVFPFLVWRPHMYLRVSQYMLAGFHAPWVWWLPVPDYASYCALETATCVGALLLLVGLGTRLVAPLVFLSYLYQMALSQMTYHHHFLVFVLVLFILATSACDEHFSVDAWIRRLDSRSGPPPPRLPVPRRLLQLLTSLIYVGGLLAKCSHYYLSGATLRHYALDTTHLLATAWQRDLFVAASPLLSWLGLAVEATILVCLWLPGRRGVAILLGLMLHALITLTMPIGTFTLQIWTLYLSFLNPAARQVCVAAPAPWPRLGPWLDWLWRVEWESTPESGLVVTVQEQRLVGAAAWVQVLLRLPLTFPLGMVGYVWLRRLRGPILTR